MKQRIQDVRCHQCPPFTMTTGRMVKKLHERGVTIEDIFGMYYAIEAQASARDDELFGNDEEGQHGGAIKPRKPLTVADVELVGLASLPDKPKPRQPF